MMNFVYSAIFFMCISTLYSQGVLFKDWKYYEALDSIGEDELLLVHFFGSNCDNCDEIAFNTFENLYVSENLNQINSIKLHKDSFDTKWIMIQTGLMYVPSTLIINKNRDYLGHIEGSTTDPFVYTNLLEKAQKNKANPPFKYFKENTADSLENRGFLKGYLKLLKSYNLDYQHVLDSYTNMLSVFDLESFSSDFQSLFEYPPIVQSLTFRVIFEWAKYSKDRWFRVNIRTNKPLIFNNGIINKSLRYAEFNESEYLAVKAAEFTKSTWDQDTVRGLMAYHTNLKDFALRTKKIHLFEKHMSILYQEYYKDLNIDSIRVSEMGELNVSRLSPNSMGVQLNKLAWDIYQMAESDEIIRMGLKMSEQSIAYTKDPFFLDTYAHLLYLNGEKDKALQFQKEAIDLLEHSNLPFIPESVKDDYEIMKIGGSLKRFH